MFLSKIRGTAEEFLGSEEEFLAIEDFYLKEWRLNGVYHREGGPAVIYADGHKEWYQNGKRHREDGPARIWGYRDEERTEWFLYGEDCTFINDLFPMSYWIYRDEK